MKKGSILGDSIALFVITLVAGCILGGVFQVTEEPIAIAKEKAKQEAYQKVFPAAAVFEAEEGLANKVMNDTPGVFINEVLVAKDSAGSELGYVMSFGSKEGYGGEIVVSMGVDTTGTITGLEILSASETAGLGAKCKTPEFKDQFKGIKSSEVIYTKAGKSADNEIDAISGSTITTKAVTGAVNNALQFIYANGQITE